MATTLKSDGITFPSSTTAPTSPSNGQIYFDSVDFALKMWTGTRWADVGNARDYLNNIVITHSFVGGGYVSTSPWKNVNEMVHSSDLCINHGDILPYAGAYNSGVNSVNNGYLWSCDDSWPGTSAQTSAFNMWTLTGFSGSTYNMRNGRNDMGTLFKEYQMAWIIGGGTSDVDTFNLATETMYTTDNAGINTATSGDSMQSGIACHSDQNKGAYWWATNNSRIVSFSTGTTITETTISGTAPGINSQQKGINSKLGKGYGGNEGSYNSGYNFRRFDYSSSTVTSTAITKPIGNSGEENFDMGQYWQYMLGMYDGAQNNRGWRFSYNTETGLELGTGSVRTGPSGGSSGHCFWRGN